MGGSDDASNIAVLTAREHFIAHFLLKKIHNNGQMINAFFYMTKPVGNGRTRYTSHSFKYAKESFAIWLSENRSGKNHPFYGVRGKNNLHFGMKRSELTKSRLSEKAKARFANGGKTNKEKRIKNLTTGEIFESINSAQRKAKSGNVNYAVRHGGTAGGHKYVFIDKFGEEIKTDSKLKGYACGSRVHSAVKVRRIDTNQIFQTVRDAAKSINVSGSAISIAINQNRSCKGIYFERV